MREFQLDMKGQVEAKATNLSNVSGALSNIHSVMEKGDPGNVEDPAAPRMP